MSWVQKCFSWKKGGQKSCERLCGVKKVSTHPLLLPHHHNSYERSLDFVGRNPDHYFKKYPVPDCLLLLLASLLICYLLLPYNALVWWVHKAVTWTVEGFSKVVRIVRRTDNSVTSTVKIDKQLSQKHSIKLNIPNCMQNYASLCRMQTDSSKRISLKP